MKKTLEWHRALQHPPTHVSPLLFLAKRSSPLSHRGRADPELSPNPAGHPASLTSRKSLNEETEKPQGVLDNGNNMQGE